MTARRIIVLCLLGLVLLLALAGFAGHQAWRAWLTGHDIERFDWQGLDAGLGGLSVERLEVHQQQGDSTRTAQLGNIRLSWDWRWPLPQLMAVRVERLEMALDPAATASEPAGAPPQLPGKAPFWLPRQVVIDDFRLRLPCATDHCQLAGSVRLERAEALLPANLDLTLNRDGHRLALVAKVAGQVPQQMDLEASLRLDGEPYLHLTSTYRGQEGGQGVDWSGVADMPALPTADWVLQWLAQWQPLPDLALPPTNTEASLSAQWQLAAASPGELLRPETGDLQLRFRLPQPWPVPGVAAVKGDLAAHLTASEGQWAAQSLDADLTLDQPADWVNRLPELIRPERIAMTLHSRESDEPPAGTLPLQLSLTTGGPTPVTLVSELALATEPPWQLELAASRLQASRSQLVLGDVTLAQPAVDLRFRGRIDEGQLALRLGASSRLTFGGVRTADHASALAAGRTILALAGQELTASYDTGAGHLGQASLKGPVTLQLDQVRHPVLKIQAWQGQGRLALDLERLASTLRLSAASGLAADLALSYVFGDSLVLDARTSAAATAASRQLSGLLTDWPDTLALEAGQVVAEASLQQGPGRPQVVSGHLQLEGLAGTWDRTAFTGLAGKLNGHLEAGRFSIGSDDLTAREINPGVPVGPLDLAGTLSGPADQPATGQLVLERAVAEFLGGQLRVPSGQWSLSAMPLRVPLELERLELSRLMELYPAEGLSGTGTLSGRVPVLITGEGIRVEQGRVTALAPGGVLKLPAERIPGIGQGGQGGQAMELIAQALKNFHYSVLNSTVDYDQDGSLNLGLRLEGRNPEVRDGYPIVLNIDLQENLPALLTSLQLSGRVNEAVTERVRELVRQQGGIPNN
ncbi:MAG: YdbH domain-containing protein [Marinobacter sp.]|uniref:YdbH domain-containing protein n=1 Tax=Marinobacter sp. TaxID=50741 RepID=UPI00299E65F6|nr:YdbH domain-containing protein [Marinobacter sp.]MDX1633892.1 YdbH domain-containing protein [Marinobacter sp.]